MKLVTAQEMREIDRLTQEDYAVPGIVLMDQAAKAVVDIMYQKELLQENSKVVIFCGSGNNGGDGFGIGRWLRSMNIQVRIFLIGTAAGNLTGDAAAEMKMYAADGGRMDVVQSEDDWLLAEIATEKADLVVDALLGTGFAGELRAAQRRACRLMNECGRKIIAVDLPSGVNADDGSMDLDAVRADVTAVIGLEKPALWLYPGCQRFGEAFVVNNGMPGKLLESYASKKYSLDDDIIRDLLPVRAGNAHKGDAGRVVVCAGSPGYIGAAALCSHAAVKAGAGLVSLLTPLSSRELLAVKLTEVMVHGLLERMPGALGGGAVSDVLAKAEAADVLVIGPGLGTSESTQQAVRDILAKLTVPAVIDADALTALQEHTELLVKMIASKVLTPHPGEMARLTGLDAEEIDRRRMELASQYAKEWQAVLVLKGAPTVIGCPDGTVYLNTTGSSALATGGSGDVLAGIIASLAAQGISLQEAALCGVYLHGLAGELACSDVGLAAGEIAGHLAEARALINQ